MGSAGGAAAAYVLLKRKKKEKKTKWECVEVGHHKNVGATVEEWQRVGGFFTAIQPLEIPGQSAIICSLCETSKQASPMRKGNRSHRSIDHALTQPLSQFGWLG